MRFKSEFDHFLRKGYFLSSMLKSDLRTTEAKKPLIDRFVIIKIPTIEVRQTASKNVLVKTCKIEDDNLNHEAALNSFARSLLNVFFCVCVFSRQDFCSVPLQC